MISNAITVATQVGILFILISVGLIIAKIKWVDETGLVQLTTILLYVVTPCVIIGSFQQDFSVELLEGLLYAAICAVGCHLIGILISKLVFRKLSRDDAIVSKFAVIFSNCGFMCVPLLYSLLGSIGVFYGSVYISIFYLFHWTYGVVLMTGNKSEIKVRQALINPGTIGTVVGLALFVFQVQLPEILDSVIFSIAGLNTPLAMFIIGAYLSNTSIMDIWKNKISYIISFYRLLLIPFISIILMLMLPLSIDLFISCVIPASAPAAAATVLFASKYRRNSVLASCAISMTTILSIITMPFMIIVADILFQIKARLF
jgi:hypothetical protein